MSEVNTCGYNLGLEMTQCYMKYFDAREVELNGLIDKLSASNNDIRMINDLVNKLTHGKKKDKKADFSSDEEMRNIIDRVYERNPSIFDDNKTYNFKSEDEIDTVLQGLDAELKMLAADLNENLMKINNKYEDRSQMTENARQVLKEAEDHIASIIRKTAGR